MLSLLDLAAILLTLSAVFGWFNHEYVPLPHTIGLLVMSVMTSGILIVVDMLSPSRHLLESLTSAMSQIDFSSIVMDGMLAFLLFAGALHVSLEEMKSRALPVLLLAALGTVISTAIVGLAMWFLLELLGQPISLAWALAFGALISPTDPVAVLSTLKNIKVAPSLEVEMQGESLFNDGVGIVLFTILVRFAVGGGGETTAASIAELVLYEAGGGLLLGVVTGYIAYSAMRRIDDYIVEVLITLALATGTYAAAQHLQMSGPLSVVTAGLLIGDRGPRYAMSNRTQTYVFGLWTLIDEILNSILFLLIGLEVLIIRTQSFSMLAVAATIPIVLLARLCAVSAPLLLFAWTDMMSAKNIPFLTWAGIRGGISIALALSLPDNPTKDLILAATYATVLFSIIVQGSTLGLVARRSGVAS
jgi:CPA1 family monovalent cation:H+ antiporter